MEMEKEKLEEAINLICKENRLVSGKEVANQLGLAEATINYYINKYGLRNKDIFVQIPASFIKLFDNINEVSSYWLGYIQSDGCLNYTRNRPRLISECQESDREILEAFCEDAKINPLRIKNTTHKSTKSENISSAVRLDLYLTSFSTFIDKWIQTNKSYKDSDVPEGVDFYSYLCGLIDGDGGVYFGQRGSQIKLLVRDPMCSTIVARLQQDLPSPTSVWIQNHPTTKGLFTIVIGSGKNPTQKEYNNFYFLYNKLYQNHYSLSRKRKKLEEILKQYHIL